MIAQTIWKINPEVGAVACKSFHEEISHEFRDRNERHGPYLSGQIGPKVHSCYKVIRHRAPRHEVRVRDVSEGPLSW